MIDVAMSACFILFVFFVLGFALNKIFKSNIVNAIPLGLLIYSGIVVPTARIVNYCSLLFVTFIIVYCVIVTVCLLKSGCIQLHSQERTPLNRYEILMIIMLCSIVFASTLLILTRLPVPPGSDVIGHSHYAMNIFLTNKFLGAYPQAIHLLFSYTMHMLSLPIHEVMQGFNVAIYVTFLLSVFCMTYEIFKSNKIAVLTLFLAIIDVNFYFNMLNGCSTHLVGIVLVIASMTLMLNRLKNYKKFSFFAVTVLIFTSIMYAHSIALIAALIGMSSIRFIHALQHNDSLKSINYVSAYFTSAILGLFQYSFIFSSNSAELGTYYFNTYLYPLTVLSLSVLVLEIVLISLVRFVLFFGKKVDLKQSYMFLSVGIATSAIYLYVWIVLSLSGRYSLMMSFLALLGSFAVGIFPKCRKYISASFWMSFMSAFYIVITPISWAFPIVEGAGLVTESLMQSWFTPPLILLATIPLAFIYHQSSMYKLLISLRTYFKTVHLNLAKVIVFCSVLFLAFYSMSDVALRTLDKREGWVLKVDPHATCALKPNTWSTFNDVNLAMWARENLKDNGIILNLGGYYGSWSVISEHRVVFARCSPPPFVINYKFQDVLSIWRDMQIGIYQTTPSFRDMEIEYVSTSEKQPLILSSPYLRLIHKVGWSRMYKILASDEVPAEDIPYVYLDCLSFFNLDEMINGVNPNEHGFFIKSEYGGRFYVQGFYGEEWWTGVRHDWLVQKFGELFRNGYATFSIPLPSHDVKLSIKSAQYGGSVEVQLSSDDEIKGQRAVTLTSGNVILLKNVEISSKSRQLDITIRNTGENTFKFRTIEVYLQLKAPEIDGVHCGDPTYMDDLQLALWVKKNIPDNHYILNIDSSNSGWFTALSQHRTVYDMYGFALPKDKNEVINRIVNDMKNGVIYDAIKELKKMDVQYVYLSANLAEDVELFVNSNLQLFHEEGNARIYKIC